VCDSFCSSLMYFGCFMHWCTWESQILIQLGVLSPIHLFWEGWLWVMKINSNLPRNIGCWLVCTISWNCSMLFIFLVLWVGWVIWLEAMVSVCQSEHTKRSWYLHERILKINLIFCDCNEPTPTSVPWRMNGKWSGNGFLLGSSSLANRGG
jgi:hypothetical protein